MDIESAKDLKIALSNQIENRVAEFEEKTGLIVESIEIERIDLTSKSMNPPDSIINKITINVKL